LLYCSKIKEVQARYSSLSLAEFMKLDLMRGLKKWLCRNFEIERLQFKPNADIVVALANKEDVDRLVGSGQMTVDGAQFPICQMVPAH